MSIVRISREQVSLRRENRKAKDIKALGYLTAITEDKPKRFYVNQNRGIQL